MRKRIYPAPLLKALALPNREGRGKKKGAAIWCSGWGGPPFLLSRGKGGDAIQLFETVVDVARLQGGRKGGRNDALSREKVLIDS